MSCTPVTPLHNHHSHHHQQQNQPWYNSPKSGQNSQQSSQQSAALLPSAFELTPPDSVRPKDDSSIHHVHHNQQQHHHISQHPQYSHHQSLAPTTPAHSMMMAQQSFITPNSTSTRFQPGAAHGAVVAHNNTNASASSAAAPSAGTASRAAPPPSFQPAAPPPPLHHQQQQHHHYQQQQQQAPPPPPPQDAQTPIRNAPVSDHAAYSGYLSRQKKEGGDDSSSVWSHEVEEAFMEALRKIPRVGRRKITIYGRPCGRNELISDYIYQKTGKMRTRKQVSSHIQVLKHLLKADPEFMALVADSPPGHSRVAVVSPIFSKNSAGAQEQAARRSRANSTDMFMSSPQRSHSVSMLGQRRVSPYQLPSGNSSGQHSHYHRRTHSRTAPFVTNSFTPVNFCMWQGQDQSLRVYTQLIRPTFESPLRPRTFGDIGERFSSVAEMLQNGVSCPLVYGRVKLDIRSGGAGSSSHLSQEPLKTELQFNMSTPFLDGQQYSWSVNTSVSTMGQQVLELTERVPFQPVHSTPKFDKLSIPFAADFWAAFIQGFNSRSGEEVIQEAETAISAITITQRLYCSVAGSDCAEKDLQAVFIYEFERASDPFEARTVFRKLISPDAPPAPPPQQPVFARPAANKVVPVSMEKAYQATTASQQQVKSEDELVAQQEAAQARARAQAEAQAELQEHDDDDSFQHQQQMQAPPARTSTPVRHEIEAPKIVTPIPIKAEHHHHLHNHNHNKRADTFGSPQSKSYAPTLLTRNFDPSELEIHEAVSMTTSISEPAPPMQRSFSVAGFEPSSSAPSDWPAPADYSFGFEATDMARSMTAFDTSVDWNGWYGMDYVDSSNTTQSESSSSGSTMHSGKSLHIDVVDYDPMDPSMQGLKSAPAGGYRHFELCNDEHDNYSHMAPSEVHETESEDDQSR